MPKSPTTTRAILSPRLGNPYTRNSNIPVKAVDYANLDIGSPKNILDPDPARKDSEGAIFDPDSIAEGCASLSTSTPVAVPSNAVPRPPRKLAVASSRVNESAYWCLTGDFMRDGIHVYSKSGKHVIEDPLAYDNAKQPRWLQVQFNVVILEESYWNCDIVLKDMGNLPCGKDVLIAVQSGGVSVE